MKRIAFYSVAAALALGGVGLYYGAPSLLKEPLLHLNRSLSGMEEKTTTAARHTIHYLDSGAPSQPAPGNQRATPLVLLHGIFAEKDHWVDFARPLTGQYRVIAPDFPGFGESTRLEDQPYDYAAHTQRLGALLDALGIEKAHLAGNSMGGTIAALFALQHPERVASVAFIGAPHGIRSPQPSTMDRLIDAGQGLQLCLGQQLLQGQQARTVEHAVAVAPQREHGVLLQATQPLLQQIAVLELGVPQAGVRWRVAQRCLLGGVQDGVGQEGALFKHQVHHGAEGCGVVGHQWALPGIDKAVHGAGLW